MVALGKIGLPLAVAMAEGGLDVRGADIDPRVVELVNAGTPPFPNEAELDERLAAVVESGKRAATTDVAAAVAASSVVVIVVPLVVDEHAKPDFGAIDAATATVAGALRPGTLVVYETTLPVHTTRTRFASALAAGSGLTLGEDLFVAHSPERVYSGRVFADLRRYPKLVGGIDEESGARAEAFYASFLEFDDRPDLSRPNGVWNLGSAEAAEMAKLAETSYRDLNIAFANQLARGADAIGVDVYGVIEACNSQPFSHIHQPGIAVGGHCIPVYPHLLVNSVPEVTLSLRSREVNDEMPRVAVDAVEAELGALDGKTVLILGVAYRGGVKEHAFSGVFPLARLLAERGARAVVSDPLYDDEEIRALGLEPSVRGERVDAAIVQADHAEYRSLGENDLPGTRVIYDGRCAVDPARFPNIIARVPGARGLTGLAATPIGETETWTTEGD
ncbi:MAG: nucleotide sugar dehydrogenase [Microthrixaceae bacterium]|nr:nucleotide sugar dehydrogenase [Microthrixaceae bacterium]